MVIKTKEFCFTAPEYFRIILKNAMKRSWWVIVLLFSMAVYEASRSGLTRPLLYMAALAAVYPLYIILRCWLAVHNKKNTQFFKERYFEIDQQSLGVFFKNGTGVPTQVKLENIFRVVKRKQGYQLFLSRKQFMYLPLSAFRSQDESNRFDFWLKDRKKNSRTTGTA